MHSWIHCNLCMNISPSQLVVTSCGKVVCSSCKTKLSTSNCRQCQGPCTRTVPLTDKAPKEVLNLFTDISEQLKAVFKNYNFQENQKRSLLDYKENRAQQVRKMSMEIASRKKMQVDLFGQMKEKLVSLERREADLMVKFNRITLEPRNMTGQGGLNQFGQGVFGGGMGHAQGVFGVGMVHGGQGHFGGSMGEYGGSGSTRQSLERAGGRSGGELNRSGLPVGQSQLGFLEMKTPAAWYQKQKDRVGDRKIARNSPQQKLMELGAVRRTEGGSKTRGSPFFTSPPAPFFTSPPTPGVQRVTPTRRQQY